MYVKTDCLLLPFSASAVLNNLCVKPTKSKKISENLAVIHQDSVGIISTKECQMNKTKVIHCQEFSADPDVAVTQVSWCKLGYESVFIVTSSIGLQVFNYQRNECLFAHPCTDKTKPYGCSFARGIGIFSLDLFCIGNSSGCIRLFGLGDTCDEICFVDRKFFHKYPIVDLSVYKEYMASVDENGTAVIWILEKEELVNIATFGMNSGCTAFKLKRDWLIATFNSGHIRLYDTSKIIAGQHNATVQMTVEVAAHSRCITGLDIVDGNDVFLTVSEDSYSKIWTVRKDSNYYVISHKCHILIKDSMLFGGKFLNNNGSLFCVTAYDNNIVACYSLQ